MMSILTNTLKSIDWTKNIETSFSNSTISNSMEKAAHRNAVWAKQIELTDSNNPALCFSREMQVSAQQSAALIGLCIYKSSAASTRTFFESALYYTFFRTHIDELETLVRERTYYVSKKDILDFHKLHNRNFKSTQEKLGLLSKIEAWYSNISAVIHGQVPGSWNVHINLSDVSYNEEAQSLAISAFIEAEEIVHLLLLCTVGQKLWASFPPDVKSHLLKGISGDARNILGLDSK